MDLIIVRHARPQRIENDDTGSPADPSLSELGVKQAEAVANFLREEKVDRIVSSSMKRAVETAQPLSSICLLYTSPSPRDQRGSGVGE